MRLRSPVFESNGVQVEFEPATVSSTGCKNACEILTKYLALHERPLNFLRHPNDCHGERKSTSAPGHYVELYIMASGGCSRTALQDHIADGRGEGTNVSNVETQFTSGLPPVVLTRMVPKEAVK